MTGMPGKSWSAPVPPLSAEERLIEDKLKHHVGALAGRIGERNIGRPEALAAAAGYIRATLEGLGYEVRAQDFESQGQTLQNLEVELPGDPAPQEIIVLGAHYDSIAGTPGANDNASGVAALLEIARLLAGNTYARSVRLVAFANEEPPFFYSDEMGSKLYAARSRQRGEQIKAMLALETIGYYTDQPASQRYPFPFRFFYPDTGNFIGFVGNLASRRLVRRALGAFRAVTAFPSEGVAAPGWMMGVHWSDHWSFWQAGYPAIMITDTALFRYPHYHSATDTPEKLDYTALARVTGGLADVIAGLAGK
ncbi:MAG: M28 family peptidase [Gammaproteobacteria bacterium]|nr:M28 family peptidase [Gammaproteobacteria bacterium]MDH3560642.1 M28 family peptidase [Gammaproteobacteria bacterium]